MQNITYEITENYTTILGIPNTAITIHHEQYHETDTTPHWHDALEITLLLEGDIQYYLNGQKFILHSGDFLLINSGVIHSTENANDTPLCALVMIISDTALHKLIPNLPDHISFSIPENSDSKRNVLASLYRIYHLMEETGVYTHLLIKSELLQILYKLCECLQPATRTSAHMFHSQNVITYVNEHYSEPISVDKAASLAGLQKNYFCRCFKAQTGISFNHYLNHVRLDAALFEFASSGSTLLECSLNAGFSGEKTMINWCRKIYGSTPVKLIRQRAKMQKDNAIPIENTLKKEGYCLK